MRSFPAWLPHLVVWLVVGFAYGNIYQNQFVYDDEFLIQKNEFLRSWDGLRLSFLHNSTAGFGGIDNFYRPLQGVLYTIVYQIAGESTVAFHVLNLLLHLLNGSLILLLARRLGFSQLAAGFAALIWAVHPVHTEAVTYMSATADPLYTLFLLAGLIGVAGGKRILPAVCFLFGLLSKESAIVFPAMAVAVVFFQSARRWDYRSYFSTLPYWVMAALYLAARATILNFDRTFDFYKTSNIYTENIFYRFLTFATTLPRYLELLIWPVELHMDRLFSVYTGFDYWGTQVGLVILLLSGYVIWRERNLDRPLMSFAVLWFTAAHVPHSGVLIPVNSFFLEHWLYLPVIGLLLVTAEYVLSQQPSVARLRIVGSVAVVVVVALASVTFMQNRVWATPISFYSHILRFEDGVARVHNNLAMAYSDAGNDEQAERLYRRAISLNDSYPQTHYNLGRLLMRRGQETEAIQHFERSLTLDSNFFRAAAMLSNVHGQAGRADKAKEYYQKYEAILKKFGR